MSSVRPRLSSTQSNQKSPSERTGIFCAKMRGQGVRCLSLDFRCHFCVSGDCHGAAPLAMTRFSMDSATNQPLAVVRAGRRGQCRPPYGQGGCAVGNGYDRSAASASEINAPMRIRTDHPHCHCEPQSGAPQGGLSCPCGAIHLLAISLYSVAITWVSTAPKASLVKGRWPSASEVGGGRQQALPSIAILRRIRTAAGLPPPFGHPPHKCGGQGDCAYLRASPFAQDDKSGGTAKKRPRFW